MRKLLITLISGGLLSTALTQCARPVEPHGGPKDTIAPVVVRSVPAEFSKNVTEKKLEIHFNEYITLKDLQKNFYMTPALDVNPTIRDNGKKLQITFDTPLEANTTYSLNFGNAIVDVNENNPIKNFSYTFSTGDQLDTLKFNGVVYDAKSMQPVADALVFLYENDSLEAPLKHKPNVIAKTDKEGVFIANTLKNKKYKVIAIKDANRNFKLDPGFDQVAFEPSLFGPVKLPYRPDSLSDSLWKAQLTPQVKLKMFSEPKKQQYLAGKARPERYKFSLYFSAPNPSIKKLDITNFKMDDFIVDSDSEGDTINYWFKDAARAIPDTLVGNITYMKTDTTGKLVEVVEKLSIDLPLSKINTGKEKHKKDEKATAKIPSISPSFESPDGSVNTDGGLFMKFATPLISMDTAKFTLYQIDDNEKRQNVAFKINQVSNKVAAYSIDADWKDDSKYLLVADSNAVVNIQHYTNDSIGYSFNTSNSVKFGTFLLDFKGVKNNIVVQILDSKFKVVREKFINTDTKVTFAYIKPDKYYIRLIEDSNNNKQWDTGNYLEQQQPERVAYVSKEKERQFQIRAGWENEITINVPEIFSNY